VGLLSLIYAAYKYVWNFPLVISYISSLDKKCTKQPTLLWSYSLFVLMYSNDCGCHSKQSVLRIECLNGSKKTVKLLLMKLKVLYSILVDYLASYSGGKQHKLDPNGHIVTEKMVNLFTNWRTAQLEHYHRLLCILIHKCKLYPLTIILHCKMYRL